MAGLLLSRSGCIVARLGLMAGLLLSRSGCIVARLGLMAGLLLSRSGCIVARLGLMAGLLLSRSGCIVARLGLMAGLLLSRSGCIVARLGPIGRTRSRRASRTRRTRAGWPRLPLQVARRGRQLLGLGLGAGHSFDRRFAAAEEPVIRGV